MEIRQEGARGRETGLGGYDLRVDAGLFTFPAVAPVTIAGQFVLSLLSCQPAGFVAPCLRCPGPVPCSTSRWALLPQPARNGCQPVVPEGQSPVFSLLPRVS